jgi:hypothetical protein
MSIEDFRTKMNEANLADALLALTKCAAKDPSQTNKPWNEWGPWTK